MEAIYLDLHIHTSPNPNKINRDYKLDVLKTNIQKFTNDSNFLISLTDHNTINTDVYLRAYSEIENIIVGVELNIRFYPDHPAYHCHAYFKDSLNIESLNALNEILDDLYADKLPSDSAEIPFIEDIIRRFDGFDFMLLPHGGQSHRTFNESIPDGVVFDDALSKSIYYNQFDGFTARGTKRLEKTQNYFRKLNINEFVNLMTCTDNYNPDNYPDCNNARDAHEFIPTWMFSAPTFDGLRLALSESSRLKYTHEKPTFGHNHIEAVKLNNDKIEIEAELSPGLNVVIGESSSGKTLFVDSIYKKIIGEFSDSNYNHFGVSDILVSNPSGVRPHFLSQNYIMSIVQDANGELNKIAIVKDVFPGDSKLKVKIEMGLAKFRQDLSDLIESVKQIEKTTSRLAHIPDLQNLIVTKEVKENILVRLVPSKATTSPMQMSDGDLELHLKNLGQIKESLKTNPLIKVDDTAFEAIEQLLNNAYTYSNTEEGVRETISSAHNEYEEELMVSQRIDREKILEFGKLLECITDYSINYRKFKKILSEISIYSTVCETESVNSEGHQLFIKNDFTLNKDKVLEVINEFLKSNFRVNDLNDLEPENLFESNFSERPKVEGYDEFERKVNTKFQGFNSKKYQIITKDGLDFDNLSPGWKTSIILDIILGYKDDNAPIIIDQPEDNLATSYINFGLVNAIKKIKERKQIILVSHNATIPMMADAQKVILCEFKDEKIKINAGRLEDKINNKSVVNYIADLTDGGKPSIKKRVKKYNLKNFKTE